MRCVSECVCMVRSRLTKDAISAPNNDVPYHCAATNDVPYHCAATNDVPYHCAATNEELESGECVKP